MNLHSYAFIFYILQRKMATGPGAYETMWNELGEDAYDIIVERLLKSQRDCKRVVQYIQARSAMADHQAKSFVDLNAHVALGEDLTTRRVWNVMSGSNQDISGKYTEFAVSLRALSAKMNQFANAYKHRLGIFFKRKDNADKVRHETLKGKSKTVVGIPIKKTKKKTGSSMVLDKMKKMRDKLREAESMLQKHRSENLKHSVSSSLLSSHPLRKAETSRDKSLQQKMAKVSKIKNDIKAANSERSALEHREKMAMEKFNHEMVEVLKGMEHLELLRMHTQKEVLQDMFACDKTLRTGIEESSATVFDQINQISPANDLNAFQKNNCQDKNVPRWNQLSGNISVLTNDFYTCDPNEKESAKKLVDAQVQARLDEFEKRVEKLVFPNGRSSIGGEAWKSSKDQPQYMDIKRDLAKKFGVYYFKTHKSVVEKYLKLFYDGQENAVISTPRAETPQPDPTPEDKTVEENESQPTNNVGRKSRAPPPGMIKKVHSLETAPRVRSTPPPVPEHLRKKASVDSPKVEELKRAPSWRPCLDATGRVYYHNVKSGETSWSLPEGAEVSASVNEATVSEDLTDATMGEMPAAGSTAGGWTVYLDEATQRLYFHNAKEGTSMWHLPEGLSMSDFS